MFHPECMQMGCEITLIKIVDKIPHFVTLILINIFSLQRGNKVKKDSGLQFL